MSKKNGAAGKAKPKPGKTSKTEMPVVKGFSTGRETAVSMLRKMEDYHLLPPKKVIPMDIFPGQGLLPGTLTLICSMPGAGKTAYLANLVFKLAQDGRCAAVFLPAITAEGFVSRMVCIGSGAGYFQMMRGCIPRETWAKMTTAAAQLAGSGIYYSNLKTMTGYTIQDEACRLAAELKKTRHKLDAVIVDTLNYLEDIEFESSFQMLRAMARELDTSVICSMGLQETKNIQKGYAWLGDIRAVGVDELETDLILNLRRPESYESDAAFRGHMDLLCVYSRELYNQNLHLWFHNQTMAVTPPKMPGTEIISP